MENVINLRDGEDVRVYGQVGNSTGLLGRFFNLKDAILAIREEGPDLMDFRIETDAGRLIVDWSPNNPLKKAVCDDCDKPNSNCLCTA